MTLIFEYAALALLVHGTALAADEPGTLSGPPAALASPPAAPAPPAPARLGSALAPDKLDSERGKADTVASEANLGGAVTGNTASAMTTGSNRIDSGSFANMSGLPVVIQNTGANVLIQNATVVNIQFR